MHRRHAAYNGLVFATFFNDGFGAAPYTDPGNGGVSRHVDIVSRLPHNEVAAIHRQATSMGIAGYRTDTNFEPTWPKRSITDFGTGPFSFAVWGKFDASGTATTLISTGGTTQCGRVLINFNGASASSGAICFWTYSSSSTYVASAGAVTGDWCWFFVTRSPSGLLSIYKDNLLLNTNTGTIRNVDSTTGLQLGWSPGDSATGFYLAAMAWNRELKQSDIDFIIVNPLSAIDPIVDPEFFSISAGGGSGVTVPQTLQAREKY